MLNREQIILEQFAYAALQDVPCVRESAEEVYMPDFVLDDAGMVQEVRYDRINILHEKP